MARHRLKQEIESTGGEATVFRAGSVEGATDKEIIHLFQQARDEEYARLAAELEGLAGALREQKRGGHMTLARLAHYEAELAKLHGELEYTTIIDFFQARGRATAMAAYERCQKAMRAVQDRAGAKTLSGKVVTDATLNVVAYQGKLWITRRNLYMDRVASAWLIKRFIDRRPRFHFVAEGEAVDGGIPFDMYEVEFGHHGKDCTLETMLKRFGLSNDKALQGIAEIVHDIDLKDNKFNRTEAAGLDAIVRGLALLLKDDRKLIEQCCPVFDGLYALLRGNMQGGGEKSGKQQARRRSGGQGKRTARK